MTDFDAWLTFAVGAGETTADENSAEGGWTPDDPSEDNPTWRGIIYREACDWFGVSEMPFDEFRSRVTRAVIGRMATVDYWVPSHAAMLPFGAVLYMDHCFNAGLGGWRIKSAAWCLQTALMAVGVDCGGVDGVLGPKTTAAMALLPRKIGFTNSAVFINALAAARLANYRTKRQWVWAGKGWTRRTEHCRLLALQLAGSPAQGT